MFLPEIRLFHDLRSGRAYPLMPELTYPFCTRVVLRDSGLWRPTAYVLQPAASDASSKVPETAIFVGKQQSRAAHLLVVHAGTHAIDPVPPSRTNA